jgi:hypothetical protein
VSDHSHRLCGLAPGLFKATSPATAPSTSHRRPSPPVRASPSTSHATTSQASTSNVAVETMCPIARTNPDTAAASAANTCARRPPFSSRAIRAVTSTVAAQARVAATRSLAGVSPNRAVAARATNGVSGGWSTYPHAGCRPATRKYSSSR